MAKLWKNLFGNGSKINASEIGLKIDGEPKTVDVAIEELKTQVNKKPYLAKGLTSTSVTIGGVGYYNATLLIAGLGSGVGLYIISRGLLVTIKAGSNIISITQATNGNITITSDGTNISYAVIYTG